MTWDSTYREHERVWGDRPSALATFACHHLKSGKTTDQAIEILDLGCGYGRDAKYLANALNCRIVGIDNSSKAVEMAKGSLPADLEARVRFECRDFSQTDHGKFDIVFASNFYHLLRAAERPKFVDTVKRNLKPGGSLFLSTLSTRDPEHFGKGKPVADEPNSFQDEKFLHFCSRQELESDFDFLAIDELSEHEYYEPRSNGEVHHHILWILTGISKVASNDKR